jgi:membrane protease YdiL (CAAX protease family)
VAGSQTPQEVVWRAIGFYGQRLTTPRVVGTLIETPTASLWPLAFDMNDVSGDGCGPDKSGGDAASPLAHPVPQPGLLRRCFFGSSGIRAGWRLCIFVPLFAVLLAVTAAVLSPLYDRVCRLPDLAFAVVVQDGLSMAPLLLAVWIMARLERRRVGDYGLPWRRAFRSRFWQGAAIGLAALSLLILMMWAAGAIRFDGVALHGAAAWRHGGLYAAAFVSVALFEEYLSFGYVLFTLRSGIGFPCAAVLSAILFAVPHAGNPGETGLGLLNAGFSGLLSCLLLRTTGDLWMAVGCHAAWDWAESYLYGVANSGNVVEGHLLNTRIAGSAWLSGGSVGPEGSVLCTVLLMALCLAVSLLFRETGFPQVPFAADPSSAASDPTATMPSGERPVHGPPATPVVTRGEPDNE